MDIAQYIGLFLIKNEYCYLPGIGSLKVEKKAASYNAETKEMMPPEYQVVYNKSSGSIDDNFANFIANNERISIAHAANYFKDFCIEAKEQLKEGKEVYIPGIGHFHAGKENQIQFETDADLKVKGKSIPFFKISPIAQKHHERPLTDIIDNTNITEPKAGESIVMKPPQINWGKIILFAVVILIVLAGIIYFIFQSQKNGPGEVTSQKIEKIEEASEPDISVEETEQAPPASINNASSYQLVINKYSTEERANKRVSQLKSYGHQVELLVKDSNQYFVVLPVASSTDTIPLIDSLNKLFGGSVHVLR